MKKVELLAPAGSFEGFKGAIHAGADAVYIGGRKYGARAYAENFTDEEVCLAIRYAHLFGRKLYLAVNTLIKESEIDELPEYILPFYEEGLDGVIVQDVGVLSLLGRQFPGLALHGSTQMTITGEGGARLLLSHGVSRVVPARELSLREIMKIKETGIEVEAFVHGAMCYCYSGQCLFSSMLGGRSGNRGRCAQPCRLPYQIISGSGDACCQSRTANREIKGYGKVCRMPEYPLSLKDMCVLPFLPELIRAGIDSFKIEGRMKKPEYAAGVTALYRKYIDRFYEAPDKPFSVLEEDMKRLRSLYIRSDIQEGYYHRHNGREMVTPDKPSYTGTDEAYLKSIREAYLDEELKIPIHGKLCLQKGKPAALTLRTAAPDSAQESGRGAYQVQGAKQEATQGIGALQATMDISAYSEGQIVQAAQKQPLTREAVKKQLDRIGNTPFRFERLDIIMEDDCFLPVKALNELRREAAAALEEQIAGAYRRGKAAVNAAGSGTTAVADAGSEAALVNDVCPDLAAGGDITEGCHQRQPLFSVQAMSLEQLPVILADAEVDRLYLDGDIYMASTGTSVNAAADTSVNVAADTSVNAAADISVNATEAAAAKALHERGITSVLKRWREGREGRSLFFVMPYIIRLRDEAYLKRTARELLSADSIWDGVMIRNLESLYWLRGNGFQKEITADAGLYVWNRYARAFMDNEGVTVSAPLECNKKEWHRLGIGGMETVVYGRAALMVTANCIRKTGGVCMIKESPADGMESGQEDLPALRDSCQADFLILRDRYQTDFPVRAVCSHCYNEIYNSIPLSLHEYGKSIMREAPRGVRLVFTTETQEEIGRVLNCYKGFTTEPERVRQADFAYTKGHYKRGVE